MTAFVTLQMFKNQNSRKSNSYSGAKMESSVPFLQWKPGYVVRSKGGENFTIKEINSSDGAMRYQDCSVLLVNIAGETRLLKGATLQTGYEFVSKGDVKDEPEGNGHAPKAKRDDCVEMDMNVAGIREFYPRKNGDGTRLLMTDKTAYIVADKPHEVRLAIKRAVAEANGRTLS